MGSKTNYFDVLYTVSKYKRTAASSGPNRAVTLLMKVVVSVFFN